MKKLRNKNKGISLIVLVITILVIIVLAGAILLIVSKNNPLDSANESVFKSDIKNFQSELNLKVVDEIGKGKDVKDINIEGENSNWKEYIPSIEGKKNYKKILQIVEGKLYIKEDSAADEIKWAEEVGIEVKPKIEIPDTIGPTIADVVASNITQISMTVTVVANDDKSGIRGYKLSKDNGETYTEEQSSNEFSLTGLTVSTSYNIKVQVIDNVGNMTTSISYELTTKSYGYNNPYIPTGFVHTEGTVNTGFVIKDTTLGNEFVWIPVQNIVDFKITEFNKGVSVGTETVPTVIRNSVQKYGGYYIGRYEQGTGNVSKKSINIWNYIDWNNSKANAETMYNNSEIGTELIYGTMWDTACNWLVSSGNKTQEELLDSTNWENHNNNTIDGHAKLQVTGYSESWKTNNIYNLARQC